MMQDTDNNKFNSALHDFHEARRRAGMQEIMARLTGKSTELLSYDDVKEKLRISGSSSRGLQDIPLDAIVGSVGRYSDFTRTFLPRHDVDAHRWARVELAVNDLAGLPPIEVYKIGEAYFVLDGNHRVSVARQLGASYIQAYVTEVQTKVPITPDIQPDELIIKARYADFLDRTHLDETRHDADLTVTAPGQYRVLEEHIQVHRYFMNEQGDREVSLEEAAASWYDTVYLPVIQLIREQGILHEFPGRTETDLYLWLSEHHHRLEQELGWEIKPAAAAADLVNQFGARPGRIVARLGGKLLDTFVPDGLEAGPPPGQWRREQGWEAVTPADRESRLFTDILVPVSGEVSGWLALDQAIEVARREGSRLRGLHVVPTAGQKDSEKSLAVQEYFNRRCAAAGIPGTLAIEVGGVARKICERARWTDLVVVNLAHPPGSQPLARLGSGFRTLIQRCATPILAVPRPSFALDRALLAYDGSPRAEEALFVATYLAARWGLALTVLTVAEAGQESPVAQARARQYLEEHTVAATFVQESGPVAAAILKTAAEGRSNLIIMGSYGFNPVLGVLLGSSVDSVLQKSWQPVLICR